jgi:hypothetical protein
MKILISPLILNVKEILAVPRPGITEDGTRRIRAHRAGGVEWLIDSLDPDIEVTLIGLQERNIGAIGRDSSCGDLGITKKDFPVNNGRKFVEIIQLLRWCNTRYQQSQHKHCEKDLSHSVSSF